MNIYYENTAQEFHLAQLCYLALSNFNSVHFTHHYLMLHSWPYKSQLLLDMLMLTKITNNRYETLPSNF